MPSRADLARHLAALIVAIAGTLGVFGLSLGMNAQVEKVFTEPVAAIEAMAAPASSKAQGPARKQRSSPVRKARKAAPSPSPLLAANLGGLDVGFGDASDAALGHATAALLEDAGAVVMNEDAVEDPPVPTTRTPPSYPTRARAQGQEGSVTLAFVVDVDGTVQDVQVLEATPPGVFDEAAVDAVTSWRFEPGSHEGAPVAVRVRQTLRFTLE